jgi:upstream activation factor subunit UAF30|tara:strand:- start:101 stop:559 length:459 start_codon:yes stop_codon:yes gene_type:complete
MADNKEINYIQTKFDGIFGSLSTFKTQISSLQQQIKGLEKDVLKDLNAANKIIEKAKNKPKRKPSGFALKVQISDDLKNFMGVDKDEMVARTEVTKFLIGYIKDNNLQNKDDRRIIECDKRLNKLLDVPNGDVVTYFNIQRYMNIHFIKNIK